MSHAQLTARLTIGGFTIPEAKESGSISASTRKKKMFLKVVMVAIVFLTPCCGNLAHTFASASDVSFTLKEESINSLIALYTSSLQIDKRFSDFTTQKLTEELGISPITSCPNCPVYASLKKTQASALFLHNDVAILGDDNMYLNLTARDSASPSRTTPLLLLNINMNMTLNFQDKIMKQEDRMVVPVSLDSDDAHTFIYVRLVENYIDHAPIHQNELNVFSAHITDFIDQVAAAQFNHEFPGIQLPSLGTGNLENVKVTIGSGEIDFASDIVFDRTPSFEANNHAPTKRAVAGTRFLAMSNGKTSYFQIAFAQSGLQKLISNAFASVHEKIQGKVIPPQKSGSCNFNQISIQNVTLGQPSITFIAQPKNEIRIAVPGISMVVPEFDVKCHKKKGVVKVSCKASVSAIQPSSNLTFGFNLAETDGNPQVKLVEANISDIPHVKIKMKSGVCKFVWGKVDAHHKQEKKIEQELRTALEKNLNQAITDAISKGFVELTPASIEVDEGVGDFSLTEAPTIIEDNNDKFLIFKMNGVFRRSNNNEDD